ncbi:hypothetical protein EMCRGX_G003780 [Ephydatia muelleri]
MALVRLCILDLTQRLPDLGSMVLVRLCILDLTQRLPDSIISSSCHWPLPPEDRGYVIIAPTFIEGHAKCVRSRWPKSLKWTMASRNPDVSNWIGHAKCQRSRWPTSLKWTMASRNPDVSNWMLEAMICQVCEVKMANITEVDHG